MCVQTEAFTSPLRITPVLTLFCRACHHQTEPWWRSYTSGFCWLLVPVKRSKEHLEWSVSVALEMFSFHESQRLFSDMQQHFKTQSKPYKYIELYTPAPTPDLKAAMKATWASITPEQCHRLIASMTRRIDAVIHAKAGPTKYWVHRYEHTFQKHDISV